MKNVIIASKFSSQNAESSCTQLPAPPALSAPSAAASASKHLLSANKVYPLGFFDSSPSTTCVR